MGRGLGYDTIVNNPSLFSTILSKLPSLYTQLYYGYGGIFASTLSSGAIGVFHVWRVKFWF